MEQITHVVDNGQRNYTLIEGGTGPIVYPAGHVAIYTLLWALTGKGADLLTAQNIFLYLYFLTHAIVLLGIYRITSIADPDRESDQSSSGNLLRPSTGATREPAKNPLGNAAPNQDDSISAIARALPGYVWAAVLLALSKRLHSIYVLRLFNDCFATFFVVIAVALTQRHKWSLSAIFFSLAVSVKMNALLFLPGAAIIYLQALGIFGAAKRTAVPFILIQILVALPFLVDFSPLTTLFKTHLAVASLPLYELGRAPETPPTVIQTLIPLAAGYLQALGSIPVTQFIAAVSQLRVSPYAFDYLSRAFEFSRVFLYKWTVNWRFVPEDIFLSPGFAKSLLGAHLATIVFGFASHRAGWWLAPLKPAKAVRAAPGGSDYSLAALVRSLFFENSRVVLARRVFDGMDPDYVLSTLVSSNLIGILFARSLHYQFYSWFYWTVPYALYRASKVYSIPVALAIWASQEWAWNTYPSTKISSIVVVNSLALMVLGLWLDGFKKYRAVRNSTGKFKKDA